MPLAVRRRAAPSRTTHDPAVPSTGAPPLSSLDGAILRRNGAHDPLAGKAFKAETARATWKYRSVSAKPLQAIHDDRKGSLGLGSASPTSASVDSSGRRYKERRRRPGSPARPCRTGMRDDEVVLKPERLKAGVLQSVGLAPGQNGRIGRAHQLANLATHEWNPAEPAMMPVLRDERLLVASRRHARRGALCFGDRRQGVVDEDGMGPGATFTPERLRPFPHRR